MNLDFESKPVYGNDEKNIKTEIKIYAGSLMKQNLIMIIMKMTKMTNKLLKLF